MANTYVDVPLGPVLMSYVPAALSRHVKHTHILHHSSEYKQGYNYITLYYIIKLFIVAKVKNCKVHYCRFQQLIIASNQ